jgi:hypothetical protein
MKLFDCLAISALILSLNLAPSFADGQKASFPSVKIEQGTPNDACFLPVLDKVRIKNASLYADLLINHKVDSGKCGCRSALLKALIYARKSGVQKGIDDEWVQISSTAPFSNSAGQKTIRLAKLKKEDRREFKIWITCDQ